VGAVGWGSWCRAAVVAALVTASAAFAATPALAAPACGTRARTPARYAHVIWILMENKDASQIIGSQAAPYVNSLRAACGSASDYHAIMHPSLPNYIALTSGGTQGISDDADPSSHRLQARSIFEQVRSWKTYAESMPGACVLHSSGEYAVRHNPATYYLRLRRTLCARDVPMGTTGSGALHRDLVRNTLPRFSFLVPNVCNDQHDCGVQTGDAWLRKWVPALVRSRAYRAGRTAIFITWDENDGRGGNRIPLVAIAPSIRRGKVVRAHLSHYALLRGTEAMLGLRYLGAAAHAGRFRRLFGV
jgi:hypothetical protein